MNRSSQQLSFSAVPGPGNVVALVSPGSFRGVAPGPLPDSPGNPVTMQSSAGTGQIVGSLMAQ